MSRNHQRLDRKRWAFVHWQVLTRDGFRCRQCGRAGRLEVHHLTALESGGEPYELSNLTTLCRPCHFKATAEAQAEKLPAEVREWRALLYSA